ncbi:MAG: hypothetical protein FJZ58_07205, partial [Chlamydiae bacterium]|nr:hypothetical protein [Chlamydiota bacterium]
MKDRDETARTYALRTKECYQRALDAYPDHMDVVLHELNQLIFWGEQGRQLCHKNLRKLHDNRKLRKDYPGFVQASKDLLQTLEQNIAKGQEDLAFITKELEIKDKATACGELRKKNFALINEDLRRAGETVLDQKTLLIIEAMHKLEFIIERFHELEEILLHASAPLKEKTKALAQEIKQVLELDTASLEEIRLTLARSQGELGEDRMKRAKDQEMSPSPYPQEEFQALDRALELYRDGKGHLEAAARKEIIDDLRSRWQKDLTLCHEGIARCEAKRSHPHREERQRELTRRLLEIRQDPHRDQKEEKKLCQLLQDVGGKDPGMPFVNTLSFWKALQPVSSMEEVRVERGIYQLVVNKPYRFFVSGQDPPSKIKIQAFLGEHLIQEENFLFPRIGTVAWEDYLTKEGGVLIKTFPSLGLSLRIQYLSPASFLLVQESTTPGYRFLFSIEESFLYQSQTLPAPPWQLSSCTHAIPRYPPLEQTFQEEVRQGISSPLLQAVLQELGKDPLVIARYVQQEIALQDPLVWQEGEHFFAPGLRKSAMRTWLEKEGSPWELCQLLVQLLQGAGYQATYVEGGITSLPSHETQGMLQMAIDAKEIFFHYPWVLTWIEGKKIPLFPWLKEGDLAQGADLYSLMPESLASASRFVGRYLKGEFGFQESVGVLFSHQVENVLTTKGLSLEDVGHHYIPRKRALSSFQDFPRPRIIQEGNERTALPEEFFLKCQVVLTPQGSLDKRVTYVVCPALVEEGVISFHPKIEGGEIKGVTLRTIDHREQMLPLLLKEGAVDLHV